MDIREILSVLLFFLRFISFIWSNCLFETSSIYLQGLISKPSSRNFVVKISCNSWLGMDWVLHPFVGKQFPLGMIVWTSFLVRFSWMIVISCGFRFRILRSSINSSIVFYIQP